MQSNAFTMEQLSALWNIAIYVRVSTTQQEREGTSLDTQFEGCVKQAEQEGFCVSSAYVYREQWTGADLDRPLLGNLRQAVQDGEVRVVYVYSPDRLSRNPFHILTLLEEFKEAGVEIRFVRGFTDDTPEGRLMMYIQGYVGQKERLEFIDRVTRGKWKTAQSGRLPHGSGRGLFGYHYDKVNKIRTVNEQEAHVVSMIFNWAFEGWTVYRIAVQLNEMNIPTKAGKLWHPLGVKRTLANEAYTGVQFYGKRRYRKISEKKREVTWRPESEWVKIEGFTPQLITRELFEAVQERRKSQQARTAKGNRRYFLTGFGKCPVCGHTIIGTSLRGNRRYYRCRGAWNTIYREAICKARYIPGEHLEEVVWNAVSGAIRDPAVLIADLQEHLVSGDGDLGVKMDHLRREIDDLKSQQRRLIELRQKDLIDLGILETQLGPVKALCDEKAAALRVFEEQQKQNDGADEAGRRVAQYCQAISEKLDDLDFDGKRATLAAFGVRFEATRDSLTITVKLDPNCTTIGHTLALRRGRSCRSRPTGIRRGWMNWLPRWRFCRGPARLRCLAGTAR